MQLDQAVAQVVRVLRKEAGMTQRELGFRTGLDPMTVSRIERAERLPSLITLLQIARVFGMTGEALIRKIEYLQPQVQVAEDPGNSYGSPQRAKGKKHLG